MISSQSPSSYPRAQGPRRRGGNIGEWRDETTRGGEADRHFCQYTGKERGGRRQGGGVSLSRRCRYKDHSCHFAMTKLCPEFSVSLVLRANPARALPLRSPRLIIHRVRSPEFEVWLEFVSLSSSVAAGLCQYTHRSFRVLPSSLFLLFSPPNLPRFSFILCRFSRRSLACPGPPPSASRTYIPSLHRAITNCSTKVSRNKRYMR